MVVGSCAEPDARMGGESCVLGACMPHAERDADVGSGMEYVVTVYDFGQSGWQPLLDPALRLLIGVVVIGSAVRQLRSTPAPSPRTTGISVFLLVWGMFWLLVSSVSAFTGGMRYWTLSRVYTTQQYAVVEGSVAVQTIQPAGGHARGDAIRVGGMPFEINQYDAAPGYHRSITHGGRLTAGSIVRIWYHEGVILRLDVWEQPVPTNTSP